MGNSAAKAAATNTSSIEEYYAKQAEQTRDATGQSDTKINNGLSASSSSNSNDPPLDNSYAINQTKQFAKAMIPFTGLLPTLVRAGITMGRYIAKCKLAVDAALEVLKSKFTKKAEQVGRWARKHRCAAVAIAITVVLLACTPAMLVAAGFTAGGVAAGSLAAGIQAGIGNVVAGSLFAILTSFGMGGFGVGIVAGGLALIGTGLIGSIIGWTTWNDDDDDVAGGEGLCIMLEED